MNPELSNKLSNRFSAFFRPQSPDSLMRFGFEVRDGWFNILWELFEGLEKLNLKDFEIVQVKEKFAGLRVYTNNSSDEAHNLIRAAEAKCAKTCENCGEPGIVREGRWLKTLCDKCATENGIQHLPICGK